LAIAALFAALSVTDSDVLATGAVGGAEEQPAKTATKKKALETLKTVLRLEEMNLIKITPCDCLQRTRRIAISIVPAGALYQ